MLMIITSEGNEYVAFHGATNSLAYAPTPWEAAKYCFELIQQKVGTIDCTHCEGYEHDATDSTD